jgi:hypothetical protein
LPSHGKKLLVLISNQSGSRQQLANQDRALTLLLAQGIEPELLDGSDPTSKDRRNELFGISGIRANYPQFFILQGETTTFLGSFDTVESMNDSGTLAGILGRQYNGSTSNKTVSSSRELPGGSTATTTTTTTTTTTDKTLVALISNMTGNRMQAANQERALTLFKAHGLNPELVDGTDPSNKDRRNILFEISGIRGNYPQFFLVESNNKTTFLGNFETMESMNDAGTLNTDILSSNPSNSVATPEKKQAASARSNIRKQKETHKEKTNPVVKPKGAALVQSEKKENVDPAPSPVMAACDKETKPAPKKSTTTAATAPATDKNAMEKGVTDGKESFSSKTKRTSATPRKSSRKPRSKSRDGFEEVKVKSRESDFTKEEEQLIRDIMQQENEKQKEKKQFQLGPKEITVGVVAVAIVGVLFSVWLSVAR